MIEFNSTVSRIFQSSGERQAATDTRRSTPGKAATKIERPDNPPASANTTAGRAGSAINFEYLPSGHLNLNQDERQNIIDFFQ